MKEEMKAGKFKAECLKIMELVKKTGRKIVITKRNVPIAKLVPIEEEERKAFGKLKGTIHFKGDVISSMDEVWDAAP